MKKKRIGIMGGTFDPIHNAHLALARQAHGQFSLDRVWVLPNGNPPHKRDSDQTDVEHRLEMVRLAIAELPFLELCDMERSGAHCHYTFETLRRLNEGHPDTQFYFIMGADSLFDFEKWREPGLISRACILLVACRDGCGRKRLEKKIEELEKKFGTDIRILDTPDMEIASETIREKFAKGEDVSKLVPAAVAGYIRQMGLYHCGRERV